MPREPKISRKTGVRKPKVSRKSKQATRLPSPEDDDDTEDEDWIGDLRQYLQQHLVMYLAKTHLYPDQQELLKAVVQEYRDKLENNFYRQHSRVDAWRKVLEKFNNRVQILHQTLKSMKLLKNEREKPNKNEQLRKGQGF